MDAIAVPARCAWATTPLGIAYHDAEWGVPLHDDRRLFEFLILEGAQAGLSWELILQKRDSYREAFDGFDPERVAAYDDAKVAELLGQSRNRAQPAEGGCGDRQCPGLPGGAEGVRQLRRGFYIWGFVDGRGTPGSPTSKSPPARRSPRR